MLYCVLPRTISYRYGIIIMSCRCDIAKWLTFLLTQLSHYDTMTQCHTSVNELCYQQYVNKITNEIPKSNIAPMKLLNLKTIFSLKLNQYSPVLRIGPGQNDKFAYSHLGRPTNMAGVNHPFLLGPNMSFLQPIFFLNPY